ncbi:MAG: hypothetical protein M1822_006303 [Bathelium mastoideum]|nr:MAG: hypothetical protein M1822_006303 [Bathelium mastoideum]
MATTEIFDEPEDVLRDIKLPSDLDLRSINIQLHQSLYLTGEMQESAADYPSRAYTAVERATILSMEALLAVHDIISQLQRLSTAIKRASAREYNMQAARERDTKDGVDEGADDELVLKNIVLHRYPDADPELQEVLATAMSFRQRRFRVWKSRHDKRLRAQKREREVKEPVPLQVSQVSASQIEPRPGMAPPRSISQQSLTTPSTTKSAPESAAPTFSSEFFKPPQSTASSVRSSETTLSVVGETRIHWPSLPRPRASDVGTQPANQCPYCFDELEVDEVRDKRKWRKHIKKDLEPYNCFYPECQSYLNMFSTEGQWLNHVRTKHAPVKWICPLRSHRDSFAFDNEEHFLAHMKNDHRGAYPESQLATLSRRSCRSDPSALFDRCILGCSQGAVSAGPELGKTRIDLLARHIANHLLSLAMESLPLRADLKGSDTGDFETEDSDESRPMPRRRQSGPSLSEVSISGSWDEVTMNADWDPDWEEKELEVLWGNMTQDPAFRGEVGEYLLREEEWGFSRFTSYPPYIGVLEDPTLERFRHSAILHVMATEDWATYWHLSNEDLETFTEQEIERQRLFHEVVQKEEAFIADLKTHQTLYRDRLESADLPLISPNRRPQFIKEVFGKLDAVIRVDEEYMMPQLKYRQAKQGPRIMGFSDIFREWIRKAKTAYIAYAEAVPLAQYRAKMEAQSNQRYQKYLDKIRQRPDNKWLSLDEFIKLPLIHIQLLGLLFTAILDTSTIISDKSNLYIAVEEIKAVTQECDISVAKMTRKVELMDLQKKLKLRPRIESIKLNLDHLGRELVWKGGLLRLGMNRFSLIGTHAILFDHYLVLAKPLKIRNKNGSEEDSYDVSKLPIPMDLLVLETADESPVTIETFGTTTVPTKPKYPLKLGQDYEEIAEYEEWRGWKPDKAMYPFCVKHLGKETYTLFAPSEENRRDWREYIIQAKTRHAAALFAQRAEPLSLEILADCFAYEDSDQLARPDITVRDTPLDRAITAFEQGMGAQVKPVCRARVNCATSFRNSQGKEMHAIGTDLGVYVRNSDDWRSWSRVIPSLRIAQIAILELFGLILFIADKSLVAYSLDRVLAADRPRKLLPSSSVEESQKLSGNRDVDFFVVGMMNERMLVFYKKKEGLSSTFKVLEPVPPPPPSPPPRIRKSRISRFASNRRDFFREYDEFYIPAESTRLNLFKSSVAVSTPRTIEVLTLDKKVPWAVPDLKESHVAPIAARLQGQVPLGMFRLSDEDFLCVYTGCAVYVNKHGDVSRSVIMEFVSAAESATLYGAYLLLFHEDYIEIRNAQNGRLRQVIPGKDIRCLNDGKSSNGSSDTSADGAHGRVIVAMQHPVMPMQLVFELVLDGTVASDDDGQQGKKEPAAAAVT